MEFLAIAFLTIISTVSADTPANCSYEDIQGEWIFQIGPRGQDKTVECNSFSDVDPVNSKLSVTLNFPDVAVDQYKNKGFWTLIYNQGFEVVINGRKYFAFSMYKQDGQNVTSYCDRTLPGWSHNVFDSDWACFTGQKVSQVPKKTNQLYKLHSKEFLSSIYYRTDHNLIEKINTVQNSWRATVYPEYEQMTLEDMVRRAGGRKSQIFGKPKPAVVSREIKLKVKQLPTNFDWRMFNSMNFVSPVRNQGKCGSCYAFSSLGMNEARLNILTNNTQKLVFSTQDIVECCEYSQGCEGGFPYLVGGKYASDFGLVEESCNPYTGKDGSCKTDKSCRREVSYNYEYIGGFYGGCNEELMMINLVHNGPLAVAFEVYNDFLHYKSGIYQHVALDMLEEKFNPFEITNHAVLLVGYGEENGEKYWTVKNSWGTAWGEDGFFRIKRGVDECSIESIAVQSFPAF